MATRPNAMLFLPPLPPQPLRAGEAVLIGRSRSCDLPLRSPDASRRHARIEPAADGGWLLRDLDSTNGTFVNGERVSERLLRPGDRIEIGRDAITFCEVGAELDPLEASVGGEAQTMMVERPALGTSFEGSLAELPSFAVLQILELGRKTGCLHAEGGEESGRIWLACGTPVHAETKRQRGFDAALALVHVSSGRFRFEPGSEAPERTIEASLTELLLEASRLLDEGPGASA
jgi:pSer/pThr/pTyr-binding forkhead associated (FHA) protein